MRQTTFKSLNSVFENVRYERSRGGRGFESWLRVSFNLCAKFYLNLQWTFHFKSTRRRMYTALGKCVKSPLNQCDRLWPKPSPKKRPILSSGLYNELMG